MSVEETTQRKRRYLTQCLSHLRSLYTKSSISTSPTAPKHPSPPPSTAPPPSNPSKDAKTSNLNDSNPLPKSQSLAVHIHYINKITIRYLKSKKEESKHTHQDLRKSVEELFLKIQADQDGEREAERREWGEFAVDPARRRRLLGG